MADRVAIVMGGASGIGTAIAQVLAREGDKAVVVDPIEDQGQSAAKSIDGHFVERTCQCAPIATAHYALTTAQGEASGGYALRLNARGARVCAPRS